MPKCEDQAPELQAQASLGSPTRPRLICQGGFALGVLVKGSSVPVTCVTANVQLGCCPQAFWEDRISPLQGLGRWAGLDEGRGAVSGGWGAELRSAWFPALGD